MKASFLVENLHKKISFLNHAVSGRAQLPVLSNFLIETGKGKIIISATDLEIGIVAEVPANIEEEGAITVPAKTFSDLIPNIEKGKIVLSTSGNTLKLHGEKIEASFQTMPAEDFPRVYEGKGEKIARITGNTIEAEFPKIAFSASLDSGRPALSGILFKKEGGGVTMVATDGYRLSLKKNLSLEKNEADLDQFIVPGRVIKEAIGIKAVGDIDLFISKKSNQILFFQEEVVLVGRLIEAEYPAYEKIIPTDFSTKAEFQRSEMQNAVKICSVFARETANIIKLEIKKNKIIVSANTPAVGENSVEIEAKAEGEGNEIAFNARYLLDVLTNIEKEDMSFEMTGPLSPGVFRIKEDPSFLHLIMPIRVQG